jgi:hypothetical protein
MERKKHSKYILAVVLFTNVNVHIYIYNSRIVGALATTDRARGEEG